jgi:predicted nucleic acid-binding protein
MTGLVFVDTNVFVYSVDSRDESKHALAKEWLGRLWRDRTGRTSTQVLSEFYYVATRKITPGLSPPIAWEHVAALAKWEPQAIDVRLLELGNQIQATHGLSWWDSLIVAAASRLGCSVLLTEDLQHSAIYAGVTAMNPFRSGVQELAGTYAAQISPVPRRGRGRPRTRPVSGQVPGP